MKIRKLFPYILGGIALLGLNSCGNQTPQPQPNPTLEQTVLQQDQGGQFPGDEISVKVTGENLAGATCNLNLDGTDFSTIYPGEEITLTYGTDLNAGTHTFTTTCSVNGKTVTDTDTITLEDATVTAVIPQKNPQGDVDLKLTWDGEKGTFTVTVVTNVDPNRIAGYTITLTPTAEMYAFVNDMFNKDPSNSYYSDLPNELDPQTVYSSTANFSWNYPGGTANMYFSLNTNDGKSLEETVKLTFSADGVLKLVYPKGNIQGTDEDEGDLATGSSEYRFRFVYVYGTQDPSQAIAYLKAEKSDGTFLDDYTQPVIYTVPNLAGFSNTYGGETPEEGTITITVYPDQESFNNSVGGTTTSFGYIINSTQGP